MGIAHDLIDLVLPSACVCCNNPGDVWCAGCRPASVPVPASAMAGVCFAAAEYDAEIRTALIEYKERGRRELSAALAAYLGDAVDVAARSARLGPVAVVPVPSRRAAARARGGDHVRRLARAVGRDGDLSVVPALRLTASVVDSAGLSVEQRAANLKHSMTAMPPRRAAPPLVIVDDIVTTGATLTEAWRALTAAGWTVAGAATVAATRRRWPDRADERLAERDQSITDSRAPQAFGWADASGRSSVRVTYFKTGASARSNGKRADFPFGSRLLLPAA